MTDSDYITNPADWDRERWPNFDPFKDNMTCSHCGKLRLHKLTLDKMQELRHSFGKPMRVNSAYRCPDHPEESKKAEPGSHSEGVAFDVAVFGKDQKKLVDLAVSLGVKGIGYGKSFTHLDWWPRRLNKTEWYYS